MYSVFWSRWRQAEKHGTKWSLKVTARRVTATECFRQHATGSQNRAFGTSSCNLAEGVEGVEAYFVDDRNYVSACVLGENSIFIQQSLDCSLNKHYNSNVKDSYGTSSFGVSQSQISPFSPFLCAETRRCNILAGFRSALKSPVKKNPAFGLFPCFPFEKFLLTAWLEKTKDCHLSITLCFTCLETVVSLVLFLLKQTQPLLAALIL